MECNKDEAIRARDIAERKFTERDFAGAKKFVLKAQNLYPALEGLSQMLTTFEVYIAAENRKNGEVDWYGILGINSSADDETVRKQYRKLALILHPDKNKSIGADGAFKLVSEAWCLLSDKIKRFAYNHKIKSVELQQRASTQTGGPSAPADTNGFHNYVTSSKSKSQTHSPQKVPSGPVPSSQRRDTFWTVCNSCKMQYEYMRIYLNHTLLCPNCHQAFMALETPPPPNFTKSSKWLHRQQQQASNFKVPTPSQSKMGRNASASNSWGAGSSANVNSFNYTTNWSHFPGADSASAAAQAASVVRQATKNVKREREEAQAATRWERRNHLSAGVENSGSSCVPRGERPFKKSRGTNDDSMDIAGGNMLNQMGMGYGASAMGSYGISGVNNKTNRELSLIEWRNMMMLKARTDVCKKINDWNLAAAAKAAEKEKGVREKEKEKQKDAANVHAQVMSNHGASGMRKGFQTRSGLSANAAADVNIKTPAPMLITVPDPDFHNFDMDRTEGSFGENQVWAAYDDDDGMPRYYAMIHKVISTNPFKVRISWLNSKTTSEFGSLDWVGSGFLKTCGDFRIGKHEINQTLNAFSHKVKYTKGMRGVIQIYPKKGDVWALYRNWSPEWSEHTPDDVIQKYDMVEVLEDYDEELGVSVTPLGKVAGFRTVFHQHEDPKEVRRIPREEMFRFSHQVPHYFLTGEEAQNAPRGCKELDPAATPLELLQADSEDSKKQTSENDGKIPDEMLQDGQGIVEEEMESASKGVDYVLDSAGKTIEVECGDG
ncbi:DnaJ domain [Dillenia turbinata]|uniref:DnaJ domain n=1 Tax=Dillenia turbinata TaxID=194707 RepID=A0AAN8V3F7_9MAGN